MIQKAQEFMNENHFADVSRVQCLLRKMMSKEYHGLIDQIKECQDPHAIFNIHGGNNLIAPTASQAEQKLVEKPADEIKKDKELKFPTPKNQGICRCNTLQSPVDMGL